MSKLKAGVGVATITPPVGYVMHCLGLRRDPSIGVHDDLKAKALMLEGDGGPLVVVSLDVVYVPSAVVEDARRRVERMTGIPSERIMLACTHNHTTPDFPEHLGGEVAREQGYDRYRPMFVDLVAGAVAEAQTKLQPAGLGGGVGRLEGWTTNRRHPERSVDDAVGVIRVDGQDGYAIAIVAGFACHTLAVGGQNLFWTADFPAYTAQVVDRLYPRAEFIFLQGAHGDILPFDWYFGKLDSPFRATYENAQRLGYALAGEVLKIAQRIKPSAQASLGARSQRLLLPTRVVPWTKEEAQTVLAEVVAANPGWESERWTEHVDHGNSATLAPGFYRVGAARAQLGLAGETRSHLEGELQIFRIGESILAANPGELFNELGLAIKQSSPFTNTLTVSCANGSVGYIPARRDYDDLKDLTLRQMVDTVKHRYLYGVATSSLAPEAGENIVEASSRMIAQLART